MENTAPNSYSIVVSSSCHMYRIENTVFQLVYWCVLAMGLHVTMCFILSGFNSELGQAKRVNP
jgi:hypothetical protein